MTFKNLYIEHERSSEAEDWVKGGNSGAGGAVC